MGLDLKRAVRGLLGRVPGERAAELLVRAFDVVSSGMEGRAGRADAGHSPLVMPNTAGYVDTMSYSRTVEIGGADERTVYTYSGAPFRGMRSGTSFYADVVPYDVTLVSELNGSALDTAESQCTPLAYNGVIFGMVGSRLGCLKEMAGAGIKARLPVRKVGMYDEGIPSLLSYTMPPADLWDWWQIQRGSSERIPLTEDGIDDAKRRLVAAYERNRLERMFGRDLPDDAEAVSRSIGYDRWPGRRTRVSTPVEDCTTSFLPVKKGSQAKPHVAIYVGGVMVDEVSARSEAYDTLARHAGERPLSARCDYFENRDLGAPVWRLTILYGSTRERPAGAHFA